MNIRRTRLLAPVVALTLLVAGAAANSAHADETHPRVRLVTSLGDITLELDAKSAPITTQNFLRYVDSGFYSGTIFHRVIERFMIQGGGFTVDMRKKGNTYTPIPLESNNGLRNERATIAMARTGDPDSATCQFFINVVDNPRLDYASSEDGNGYAVFGRVVDGMDVVDAIQSVPTTAVNGREDVPVEPVLIESADRVDRGVRSSR
ncbi:MAG: peptidyl-prolyl cis-trans isomerase [Candidatus Eisenbacteria bacterium]|uniref:Peptidyl-prolyl cis-trans isomerase n=1 Tax=Eiseniibacteriota bacterium TaxID=2212470 RepID=A0A956NF56_UNCEI|nr:peptidyl-prolyl cis-trans isomerase [Candidatus Eisenbacteria bacterium]